MNSCDRFNENSKSRNRASQRFSQKIVRVKVEKKESRLGGHRAARGWKKIMGLCVQAGHPSCSWRIYAGCPQQSVQTSPLAHLLTDLRNLACSLFRGGGPPLKYRLSALCSILSALDAHLSLSFSILFLFPSFLSARFSPCSSPFFFSQRSFRLVPLGIERRDHSPVDDERSIYIAANLVLSPANLHPRFLVQEGEGEGDLAAEWTLALEISFRIQWRGFDRDRWLFRGRPDVFNVIAFYGGMLNP